MTLSVHGLHHITAIAGPAQENLDFYAGILGMRLVKRSINQDDPGTYHLFYADAEGHPGTDLTFFPWAQMAPPRMGHGLAVEVGLEVPAGSLAWWGARLEQYGVRDRRRSRRRFGDTRAAAGRRARHARRADRERRAASRAPFTPWDGSPIPVERQIRGLYGAQMWERDEADDRRVHHGRARLPRARPRERLDALRLRRGARRRRHQGDAAGTPRRLGRRRRPPPRLGGRRSRRGAARCARRSRPPAAAPPTSSIASGSSRCISRSPAACCSRSPPKGPGFAVDEDPAHLGESLVLPPWFEPSRARDRARAAAADAAVRRRAGDRR